MRRLLPHHTCLLVGGCGKAPAKKSAANCGPPLVWRLLPRHAYIGAQRASHGATTAWAHVAPQVAGSGSALRLLRRLQAAPALTVSKGCMVMPAYVPCREGCTLLLHRQCRLFRQSTCTRGKDG